MRFSILRNLFLVASLAVLFLATSVDAQDSTSTVGTLYGEHNDYILFTPITYSDAYFLIDDQGRIVNQWHIENVGRDARLRENGNIVTTLRRADQSPDQFVEEIPSIVWSNAEGGFAEYTWDGELVWEYHFDLPGYRIHHGFELMPNGNILFIAWEYFTAEEAIANGRNPEETDESFWPDAIFEYDPQLDELVWEWHAWDHIIQDFDPNMANYGDVAANPQLIDVNYTDVAGPNADWMHANAVDYNPELGQILINVIYSNEIWIIDHNITTEEAAGPAGDLLYRWGNPQAYRRGGPEDVQLGFGHDAQWIPPGYPGAGNIIMYSNRHQLIVDGEPTGEQYSKIIEFTPPLQEDGTYALEENQPYGPEAPTWTYDGLPDQSFFSRFISGTERLPNGNTMIYPGAIGNMIEVTPDGEQIWRYVTPVNGQFLVPDGGQSSVTVFRARRYEADFAGFEGRDLTPGLTLEELAGTSLETAGWLVAGDDISATFYAEQESAYYTFRPGFGRQVSILAGAADGDFTPSIQLMDIDMNVLAEGEESIEGYRFFNGTRYIIKVSHNAGVDFEGTYRIALIETDNPFETAAETAEVAAYDTLVTGTITDDATLFIYRLEAVEGDIITLQMTAMDGDLKPSIALLTADGALLERQTDAAGAGEIAIEGFEIEDDGTYIIAVTRHPFGELTIGDFELEILNDTP